MRGDYHIQLKSDVQPYALCIPSRIPLSLMPKVKDEIGRLLSLGVIERVDVPTEWCASIVTAPKSPDIRLYVNLSRLKDSVMRERHNLPSVDQVLAQLADARIFSKLDCYNTFLAVSLGTRVTTADYLHHSIWEMLLLTNSLWNYERSRTFSEADFSTAAWY